METTAYVVIRKTEDREWIDISTISLLPGEAKYRADECDKWISTWAKDNKQVRVVQVRISTIPFSTYSAWKNRV